MKIAVIGSGISGLSAAYFLSKHHKVDLYEQNDHFGGHSYTYDIKEKDKIIPVDLGFIVFNELTYPNLINFFNELNVPFEKSNMSFSVSVKKTDIEYGGSGFNAIFANKSNLLNFNFLKMIREIINFYNYAPSLLNSNKEQTLGEYLERSKLSKYFIIILSLVAFFIASKGFDILYLFLLADLFCCAFVYTVFYSFYNKNVNEKAAYFSIIIGLIGGFLLFPFPDFSKSLLVGVFLPKEFFSPFITQSLLFLSFLVATFLPAIILKIKILLKAGKPYFLVSPRIYIL